MSRLFFLSISFLLSFSAIAQKGFLRGNVADGDFGGPMIGAAITVADKPGVGTITDFDGNYSLPLEPGTYTINISFISYATKSYTDVVITEKNVTVIDAVLSSAIEELGVVEITAEARRNSESMLLMDMKNATNVTDGLSAQTFRKIGDSDLGGAIRRVTGVTVQNGKYVYVRGLGDRYTKTTLNGMEIPGLDPDANSVQIDIFPTVILENVTVSKTFSPDLYGDFTGGLVNVVTKSFPEQKTNQVRVAATYTPGVTFNPNYVLYKGGKLDWAAQDDGTRKNPLNPTMQIPDPVQRNPELSNITGSFNPEMAAQNMTAMPSASFSYNHGNQINKENGGTYGYNVVFNYQNQTNFYRDYVTNFVAKNQETSVYEMDVDRSITGVVGLNNVMWSGLLNGSYKKKKSTVSAILLHTQTGESRAAQRRSVDTEDNQGILLENILTYTQRTLSTFIVNGEHKFGNIGFKWANASSYSRVYDPDFRETRISVGDGDTNLNVGNGSGITRFYRDLHEYNESVKFDFEIPISTSFKIKTGLYGNGKYRDFNVMSYLFRHIQKDSNGISADPDWFLQPENIIAPVENNTYSGTYVKGNFEPLNQYQASQLLFAGYLMAEHELTHKLKLIYGARIEKMSLYYTGLAEINSVRIPFNNKKTLDALNVLPALNSVYKLSDKMNLRASFSRTIARPSFKEKSFATIYDPITKRTFVGNIDLDLTHVNNYDLRYEWFLSPKELFSVGAFYKQFDGHIELVSNYLSPDEMKPRNNGKADVLGAEIELRKALVKADSTFLSRFFIGGNATLVNSRVDMKSVNVDNEGKTEYELRTENLRDGESIYQYRPMAGQSPYAVNANISYEDPIRNFTVSVAYNVQGEQLSIIGSGQLPDVYTIPFNSLNINAFKSFGKDLNSRISLRVTNVLNDDRTLVYKSYKAKDQIFTSYRPGVGISLRYSYNF